MQFDASQELDRLERKLKALRQKEYIPDALLEIVARTAAIQLESRAAVKVSLPAGITAAEAHLQGAPLLERDAFPYDREQAAHVFGRLLSMMRGAGGQLAAGAEQVRAAMETGELKLDDAFAAILRDDQAWQTAWAERMPDAPSLVRFLALGSIAPSLEAISVLLAGRRDTQSVWQHGHCPHCGSAPLISRLIGKEGARHHTCSFCRHEYRAARIQCPFCLETASDKLEYFSAEGEPGFQVHVCRSCDSYIKTVDFREFDRVSIPVLDDLESLTLDILARQQGFERPTPSAWGF